MGEQHLSQSQKAPPGPAEILASIRPLAEGNIAGLLVAVLPPRAAVEIAHLNPTQKILPALYGVIESAVETYCDCETIAYDPAESTADGQVMWLSSAEVPLLAQLMNEAGDLASLPPFQPDRAHLASLRLAGIVVQGRDQNALFVENLRGSQVVARSKNFGALLRRGVLDAPNGEVVMLTEQVMAIVTQRYIYFRNRKAFQQLFGLLEEVRERAKETLLDITASLRIDGFDEMLTAVQGAPAMLGKMASIQSKLDTFPLYRQRLTMPTLVRFVRSHPECKVEVTGTGSKARLVFRNDPQNRFKILKLLDDDYLMSELTSLKYEANSKSGPLS